MIGCKLPILYVRGALSLKANKNLPEDRPLVGYEPSRVTMAMLGEEKIKYFDGLPFKKEDF